VPCSHSAACLKDNEHTPLAIDRVSRGCVIMEGATDDEALARELHRELNVGPRRQRQTRQGQQPPPSRRTESRRRGVTELFKLRVCLWTQVRPSLSAYMLQEASLMPIHPLKPRHLMMTAMIFPIKRRPDHKQSPPRTQDNRPSPSSPERQRAKVLK
jgi:hypothetical protein